MPRVNRIVLWGLAIAQLLSICSVASANQSEQQHPECASAQHQRCAATEFIGEYTSRKETLRVRPWESCLQATFEDASPVPLLPLSERGDVFQVGIASPMRLLVVRLDGKVIQAELLVDGSTRQVFEKTR